MHFKSHHLAPRAHNSLKHITINYSIKQPQIRNGSSRHHPRICLTQISLLIIQKNTHQVVLKRNLTIRELRLSGYLEFCDMALSEIRNSFCEEVLEKNSSCHVWTRLFVWTCRWSRVFCAFKQAVKREKCDHSTFFFLFLFFLNGILGRKCKHMIIIPFKVSESIIFFGVIEIICIRDFCMLKAVCNP